MQTVNAGLRFQIDMCPLKASLTLTFTIFCPLLLNANDKDTEINRFNIKFVGGVL